MPTSAQLLKQYGLAPKKTWGQNFLVDPGSLDRIVQGCHLDRDDKRVVEIGAGLGALTERLLAADRKVVAIERDRDMVHVLRERFAEEPGLTIAEENALTFDYPAQADDGPFKLVGNLPYQISSSILFLTLEHRSVFRSAHFLLQKEVAQRLAATPGNKDYSILSVLFGRVFQVQREALIGKGAFVPPPKIDSLFVSLFPRREPVFAVEDEKRFTLFIKAAFHQRRKTLENCLKRQPFLEISDDQRTTLRETYPDLLKQRAEQLDLQQFGFLYAALNHETADSPVSPPA